MQFSLIRGVVKDGDISALSERVAALQERVNSLRETENTLDHLCRAMKENYRQTRKSPSNEYYAYVTRDDLIDVFGEDSVTLTVRNFDTVRESTKTAEEDETDVEKHTLRVHGLYKTVDVRLVTTDGEMRHRTPPPPDDSELDSNGSSQIQSSSQPIAKSSEQSIKRRPGRRRKTEIKDDDADRDASNQNLANISASESTEDNELAERRLLAKSLLGYRPPRKQLKRNLDDESDSFECR